MNDSIPEFTQPQLSFGETQPGYCACGCGQKTKIAKKTSARDRTVKGQPYRFISGHNTLQLRDSVDNLSLPSDTRAIPLTQGKVAIVDAADYEWLSQWSWYAMKSNKTFYAVRSERLPNGKKRLLAMHRVIAGTPSDMEVDHKDGNGLTNTRDNLRHATHQQNMHNRRLIQANNTSGFKGVHWHKGPGKWVAQITANGKNIHLGYFTTAEEAAHAYDAAARLYHGEYAWTNFENK